MESNIPFTDYREVHQLLTSAFTDRDPLAAAYTASLTVGLSRAEIIAAAGSELQDDHTGIWLPTQIWMPKIGDIRDTFAHHPIGPRTAKVLRWHLRQQQHAAAEAGEVWHNPSGLVFTDATGRPWRPDDLERRLHHRCRVAGLRECDWVTLKYAAAIEMGSSGVRRCAIDAWKRPSSSPTGIKLLSQTATTIDTLTLEPITLPS